MSGQSSQNWLSSQLTKLNLHLQHNNEVRTYKIDEQNSDKSSCEQINILINQIAHKESMVAELRGQKAILDKRLEGIENWATAARAVFLELQNTLIADMTSAEVHKLVRVGEPRSEFDDEDIRKIREQSVIIFKKFRNWREKLLSKFPHFLQKEHPMRADLRQRHQLSLEQIAQLPESRVLEIATAILDDLINYVEDGEKTILSMKDVFSKLRPFFGQDAMLSVKDYVKLLVSEIEKEVRLGRIINRTIAQLYSSAPIDVGTALVEDNQTKTLLFVSKYNSESSLLAKNRTKLISIIKACPPEIKPHIADSSLDGLDWEGIIDNLEKIINSLKGSYKEIKEVNNQLQSNGELKELKERLQNNVSPASADSPPSKQLAELLEAVKVVVKEYDREKIEHVQAAQQFDALMQQRSRKQMQEVEASAKQAVDLEQLSSLKRQLHSAKHEHKLKDLRAESLANDLRRVCEARAELLRQHQQLQGKHYALQRLAGSFKEAPAIDAVHRQGLLLTVQRQQALLHIRERFGSLDRAAETAIDTAHRQELLLTVQRQQALLHVRERFGSLDKAAIDIADADRQHDRRLARIAAWNYLGLALAALGTVLFVARWLAERRS